MKVCNISRAVAEQLPGPYPIDSGHWLISISSSQGEPATIVAPFGRVERFVFDDVNKVTAGCIAFDMRQAERMAGVIREVEAAGVTNLWVHRDAGACRSGAVVEACLLLGHTLDASLSHGRVPNTRVFEALRRALGFQHSWEKE